MKTVWYEGRRNSDLTEGKGREVADGKWANLADAVKGVQGIDFQGTPGTVVRCELQEDESGLPKIVYTRVWGYRKNPVGQGWGKGWLTENLTEVEKVTADFTDENIARLRVEAEKLGYRLEKA